MLRFPLAAAVRVLEMLRNVGEKILCSSPSKVERAGVRCETENGSSIINR